MRRTGQFIRCAIALGVLLLCSTPVLAAAPSGSTDSLAIRSRTQSSGPSATQPIALPSLGFDITRMMMALAIVIALIYFSRWVLKRFYGGSISPTGNRAVQVLGRTVLAPRQQVLLLQVGRRVIVVGESNGTMVTLAQIDDPDEIAQLVGRLHDERTGRPGAFGALFGRAQSSITDDDASAPLGVTAKENEERTELSGLLEKVRSIRGQIGRD